MNDKVRHIQPVIRLLTPWGPGGVAVIEICGPPSTDLLASCFRPAGKHPLNTLPPLQQVFGYLGNHPVEECVAYKRDEEHWELHCHSGHAIVSWVLDTLVRHGAVIHPTIETEVECLTLTDEVSQAVNQARTEKVSAVLLHQLQDGLAADLRELTQWVASKTLNKASDLAQKLMATWPRGQRILRPFKVVLRGATNVGKSSLLNAIAGYTRAIVSDLPGTTRDALALQTSVNGWPVDFYDTAGMRETLDPIEQAGQLQAQRVSHDADLILAISDASHQDSHAFSSEPSTVPTLHVLNKQDLSSLPIGNTPAGITLSAVTGAGLSILLEAVAEYVNAYYPHHLNDSIVFTKRQFHMISKLVSPP